MIIGKSGYVNIDYRQFEIWRYLSWSLPLFYFFLVKGAAVLTNSSYVKEYIEHKSLIDRLDIGYTDEEKDCNYQVNSRYNYSQSLPFMTETIMDSSFYYDAARGILGYDSFVFETVPGKTHWLVARCLIKTEVIYATLEGTKKLTVNTANINNLTLTVGKEYQIEITMQDILDKAEGNIIEWAVKIPAGMIRNDKTKFSLYGDHIVCDYWLYVD